MAPPHFFLSTFFGSPTRHFYRLESAMGRVAPYVPEDVLLRHLLIRIRRILMAWHATVCAWLDSCYNATFVAR